MLNLTSLVLYICVYTTIVVMAEFIDSDFHTQSSSIVDPGQDLELEPIIAFYLQVPDNVSYPSDRCHAMMSDSPLLTTCT